MMSQTGSDATAAGALEAPGRSAKPLSGAAILLVTFMSAMLTYFGFMLQKHVFGRKDHTETALFAGNMPVATR
jgi:hypothetical protein